MCHILKAQLNLLFLCVLSMSLSSVRYNFKWLRCLLQWSHESDPHLGWLLLAKLKDYSARACVVWGTEYNSDKWKEWKQEDVFCSLQFSSDVLGRERERSQAQGGRWKSSSLPRDTAFGVFPPPQTEPDPCRDEQWRAGGAGSLSTSPKSLYKTAKHITRVVQGLSSTCLQAGSRGGS